MGDVQYTTSLQPRRRFGEVKLDDALLFQSEAVRAATRAPARQLESLGIRYPIAGGLAVGAHGHVRLTRDVHFLVGDQAFERHGGLVTFKPGVPIEHHGVRIDYLTTANLGAHVEAAFETSPRSGGLPVVSVDILVYMKLAARRPRDRLDVIELIRAGIDTDAVREYLERHAPDLVPLYERLESQAAEDD